jgi:hypothetical protein
LPRATENEKGAVQRPLYSCSIIIPSGYTGS